ncbi:nucleotidyltransferase family protein [uncultured Acetobacteroides sp.]|uniref:nucleotidyltransferase family protein n=1 Tax=uncultured Acetobacteroides sp. TaxID=1760811 RepID=UPI0029F50D5F|nr:nucleotidyltransferase family protein [uncultured Acetobacteroides sp.]
MKAMVFCAGLGTRLKPLTDDRPKALVPLAGKPLIEHVVERLKSFGFTDIIVNVHHFADKVEAFLAERGNFGVNITVSDERNLLLDTGGGLKKAAHFFSDGQPFLIHNVDIISDINLAELYGRHVESRALASLAVSNRLSSRYFLFDNAMQLAGWKNIKTNEQKIARVGDTYLPFAFNGIHVVNPAIFELMDGFDGKFSIVDLYLQLAKSHFIEGIDVTKSRIIDVGKPAALLEAEKLIG